MRVTLLLVCVGWLALVVSAQEEPLPDNEFFDELALEGDFAAEEAVVPLEEEVTEATTAMPKPTKPPGRKRLIPIRRIPNRDRPRSRPTPAPRSPVTQAITESPAPSTPVQNTRSRGRGRRPSSRVSSPTQVDEPAADTPQEEASPSRSRFSRPGSRRTSSRASSATGTATTEATLTTTHRFGGRRRLPQRSNPSPAANQETDNATPAPSRFGRRRRV